MHYKERTAGRQRTKKCSSHFELHMNTFTSLDSGVVARAKKKTERVQGLMGREQISLFLYSNPTTPPAPRSTIPQLTALKKGATPGETKFSGGSVPSSKRLPFYTPFLAEKVTLPYTFHRRCRPSHIPYVTRHQYLAKF